MGKSFWYVCIFMLVIFLSTTIYSFPLMSQEKAEGEHSLDFNPANYVVKSLTINGKEIKYRAYENIVYVKFPVDTSYQSMNYFVPVEYYNGESIGNYSADTAPIFFPNTVGGYMPGKAGSPGTGREGTMNAAAVALSKGYVVAEPGARGRTNQGETGLYTGKAPACIVDLKAAVRYLRYNDKAMPGDAEKIISNGTSAGGALSALLGATGNSKDYEPYLKALGAADVRDDIYAVSAYCPITNLDHADMAYEWLFNGVNNYERIDFQPGKKPEKIKSELTEEQIKVSNELKAMFPAYLNSLSLKDNDGNELVLDANGNGTFKEYVKSFVIASAQKALSQGYDLSDKSWITIKDGKVTDIDFNKYVEYATRMKTPPAFDGLDLTTPENGLFGDKDINTKHFTGYSMQNDKANGTLADATIVKMMNPMNYIGKEIATVSKHWRIRHGSIDRDTSLAIPTILATDLMNNGFDVDFAIPWDRPHSGDYDLDELFDWMAQVCK